MKLYEVTVGPMVTASISSIVAELTLGSPRCHSVIDDEKRGKILTGFLQISKLGKNHAGREKREGRAIRL